MEGAQFDQSRIQRGNFKYRAIYSIINTSSDTSTTHFDFTSLNELPRSAIKNLK